MAVCENPLLRIIDIESYFATEERQTKTSFNFNIFENLNELFMKTEINKLTELNKKFQNNFKKFPKSVVQKEFERITVEFSWKSSQMEGNTYSLLETEVLLKYGTTAGGRSIEEATMIINHKRAMSFILQNLNYFNAISVTKIQEIHKIISDKIISEHLKAYSNIRKTPVGIIGTNYKPLDNVFSILEVLERTCNCINNARFGLEKALIAIAMISYIQPFIDCNKRTTRAIGNALLLANGFCPLSYKSVSEVEYKKAIIVFYEQNSINYFKQLFVNQFRYAVDRYF